MARKKDYECGRYDVDAVMSRIPELLGMELTLRSGVWEGRYYINGERHPYKRDKLKVKTWAHNGRVDIFIHEQGGQSLSLPNWLQQYGGASNYAHAMCIIQRNELPSFDVRSFRTSSECEVKYVSREVFEEYRRYELERCNLFVWMCRMFGESRVREAFERYNVTTNERGDVVYWYVDDKERILHDKIMRYKYNGKRDHAFTSRKFKVGDGYRENCLFGCHLIEHGKEIHCLEGEKSALILSIVQPDKIWVATGGLSNLRECSEEMWLYPDIDAIDRWSAIKGAKIVEWWKDYENVGDKDDYADLIVREAMGKYYDGGNRYR